MTPPGPLVPRCPPLGPCWAGRPGWTAGKPPLQPPLRLGWDVKGAEFEVVCSAQGRWGQRPAGTQDWPALPCQASHRQGAPNPDTVRAQRERHFSPVTAAEWDSHGPLGEGQTTRRARRPPAPQPPSHSARSSDSSVRTAADFEFGRPLDGAPPRGQSLRPRCPADVRLGPWSSHHLAPQRTERRRSEHIHV